eukprot:g52915.t1
MERKSERAQSQTTTLSSKKQQKKKMERKSERAQSPPSFWGARGCLFWCCVFKVFLNIRDSFGCGGWGCLPCSTALPAKLFCPLPWLSLRDGYQPSPIQAILDDEDEDQQPHFKVTTHEHTTIQPLERAMRPDSPTHEQGLQEEQKSDQQDEISIEQSLADDQDTNLSTGPMPSSDFTAPEEPPTDPNRCKKARADSEKRTSYATSSLTEIGA